MSPSPSPTGKIIFLLSLFFSRLMSVIYHLKGFQAENPTLCISICQLWCTKKNWTLHTVMMFSWLAINNLISFGAEYCNTTLFFLNSNLDIFKWDFPKICFLTLEILAPKELFVVACCIHLSHCHAYIQNDKTSSIMHRLCHFIAKKNIFCRSLC